MPFCDKCGKQNRDQARFCGYCGQPLQVEAQEPSEKEREPPPQSESKSKSVTVSGLTKSQRKAELARIRKKFESRGWVFVEYQDEFLGRKAFFQVPTQELQRLRRRNWLIGAAIVGVVVIASLLSDNHNYDPENYDQETGLHRKADESLFNFRFRVAQEKDRMQGKEISEEEFQRQANSPEFHKKVEEIVRTLQFGTLFRAECERKDVSAERCEELMRMAAFGRTTLFPHDIETQQEADVQAKARDEAIPLLWEVCATDRDFPECKQLAVLPTLSFTAKHPR